MALCLPALGAGPLGEEGTPWRKQAWVIPGPAKVEMQAVLYRPKGDGPFPLAVVNHGSDESGSARRRQAIPDWPELVGLLVAHGYAVVLPLRPGHGATGGSYLESQGYCGGADYVGAGRGAARSIAATIDYMRSEPFIHADGTLLVGNSAGAWGALALAAQQPAGVAGVIDFAGGRGGREGDRPGNNCAPDKLVAAAAVFGATTAVPTLWLYAQNDTFFPPELSRRMADAFAGAGGAVDYRLLGPVRGDGHALIATEGKEASWKPAVLAFLKRLGR